MATLNKMAMKSPEVNGIITLVYEIKTLLNKLLKYQINLLNYSFYFILN